MVSGHNPNTVHHTRATTIDLGPAKYKPSFEVFAGKTVTILTHSQQEVLAFTEANNKLVVPKLDCQG